MEMINSKTEDDPEVYCKFDVRKKKGHTIPLMVINYVGDERLNTFYAYVKWIVARNTV